MDEDRTRRDTSCRKQSMPRKRKTRKAPSEPASETMENQIKQADPLYRSCLVAMAPQTTRPDSGRPESSTFCSTSSFSSGIEHASDGSGCKASSPGLATGHRLVGWVMLKPGTFAEFGDQMLRASQTCANHGSERVAGIGLSTTRMPKSVPKAGLTGVTPVGPRYLHQICYSQPI